MLVQSGGVCGSVFKDIIKGCLMCVVQLASLSSEVTIFHDMPPSELDILINYQLVKFIQRRFVTLQQTREQPPYRRIVERHPFRIVRRVVVGGQENKKADIIWIQSFDPTTVIS